MYSLNWIDPREYSFNHMLLMERFQIEYIVDFCEDPQFRSALGIALRGNPHVTWYFEHMLPERADDIRSCVAPGEFSSEEIRAAELTVIDGVQDFVIYTTPEKMSEKCDWIYGWNKQRLYEMADFAGKTVLDVGSGSGRLAFAAAEVARFVYSSEPVGCLREFQRRMIREKGIGNVRVVDGMCDSLPYPDNTFDIVMSGHVVGDHLEAELSELERVVKSGGWLLDCPGDQHTSTAKSDDLLARGWEEMPYEGTFGLKTYRYRKQVFK